MAKNYTFFVNTQTDEHGRRTIFGHQPGDQLTTAWNGTVPPDRPTEEQLEWLFKKFNIAHPDGYRGPSMSIGDVVRLTDDFGGTEVYTVAPVGFKKIEDAEAALSNVVAEAPKGWIR